MKNSTTQRLLSKIVRHLSYLLTFIGGEKEKPFDIELCRNFNRVLAIFARLKVEYREIIKDITKRMGQGMAEFIDKEVITIEDYNLYCHYVAGLVGIGLTKSFIAYGESKALLGTTGNEDYL